MCHLLPGRIQTDSDPNVKGVIPYPLRALVKSTFPEAQASRSASHKEKYGQLALEPHVTLPSHSILLALSAHIYQVKNSLRGCGSQSRTWSCAQRNIEGGKCAHESPYSVLNSIIPMGTRERFLLSPSTMEMLRDEEQE